MQKSVTKSQAYKIIRHSILTTLTFRTFVVEHSIGPNADIEFAGHETVCVFVPCGQLAFVLEHARFLVVRI